MAAAPTTIAFYLPQFYPIPANSAWYGPGFTEWHNVVQARPLFPGHYQPHLPRDFGFYDLRVPELREAQARAAKAHGIDAFCYYHYWFEGQRPLRLVVDDVLEHGCPDIPFCLAWANHNWSRHWDGSDRDVLLTQRYSPADDDAHGRFLLRAMSHPLYLKVDGRPVLFIYRIEQMLDPARTLLKWRELWRAEGIDDVQIVKFDAHGDFEDPAVYGADAAAQFLPHGLFDRLPARRFTGASDGNVVIGYEDVVRHCVDGEHSAWRRHECVLPGWDNSPRRGDGRSSLLHGSTPELYEEWLAAVCRRTPAEGMILLNAWNEWAEGAHLEPDLRHGDGYLKATARALGVVVPADDGAPLTPLAAVPFSVADRFAQLYLDAVEAQTTLQRRLSRLEATFDRQLEFARAEIADELQRVRAQAATLVEDNERLRARLATETRNERAGEP